jgi:hypothetical protein
MRFAVPLYLGKELPPLKALTRLKRPPILKRDYSQFVGGGSREALLRFSVQVGFQPATNPLWRRFECGYSFPIKAFYVYNSLCNRRTVCQACFPLFHIRRTALKNHTLVKIADLGDNKLFIDFYEVIWYENEQTDRRTL